MLDIRLGRLLENLDLNETLKNAISVSLDPGKRLYYCRGVVGQSGERILLEKFEEPGGCSPINLECIECGGEGYLVPLLVQTKVLLCCEECDATWLDLDDIDDSSKADFYNFYLTRHQLANDDIKALLPRGECFSRDIRTRKASYPFLPLPSKQ